MAKFAFSDLTFKLNYTSLNLIHYLSGIVAMHLFNWAIAMTIFWLLLSGFFQPLLLLFGALSVALVVYTIACMDKIDKEIKTINFGLNILSYWGWLLGQIFLSSVQVTRLVWGGSTKLAPKVGYIKMSHPYELGRVLYANSITLTPGTLSVDVIDDTITVHALEAESLEDLRKGGMEKRIIELKGNSKK